MQHVEQLTQRSRHCKKLTAGLNIDKYCHTFLKNLTAERTNE